MKERNAIVMATAVGCECDTWMLVMAKLKEKIRIHPRYFIYYDEKKLLKSKDEFLSKVGSNVFFQNGNDNNKGKGYYEVKKNNVLDESLLNAISSYELIALKMMDRFDPFSKNFSFTNRQYYFRELVLRWLDIIDELSLEIFITPDVPHLVSDYALYVACKIKGIEFLFFDMVPFGDTSIIHDDINAYNVSSKKDNYLFLESRNKAIEQRINSFRGDKKEYNLWYITEQEKQKKAWKSYPHFLINKIIESGWLFNPIELYKGLFVNKVISIYVKPQMMPYNSDFSFFEKSRISSRVSKKSKSYLSLYTKLVTNIDLVKEKYIIFALHYQPEATTSPSGGVFVDQLLVIDLLDRLLPPDITILIKEHKSQFYGVLGSASVGRSKVFYERLGSFSSRVKIVSLDIESFDLIDNSQAVVTVTGTIGIESLCRGKPVLCFGRAWYENCPGAFKIRNKEDLLSAWKMINREGFLIDQEKVDEYIYTLANDFIWGLHSGVYKKISNRAQSETVENIVNGIIKFLKKKRFIKSINNSV